MTASKTIGGHSRIFARNTVITTGVIVSLYALAVSVQFQPLQIPGYLLILGFDWLEMMFGSAGKNYDILFAGYLLGLGLLGAAIAHVLNSRID